MYHGGHVLEAKRDWGFWSACEKKSESNMSQTVDLLEEFKNPSDVALAIALIQSVDNKKQWLLKCVSSKLGQRCKDKLIPLVMSKLGSNIAVLRYCLTDQIFEFRRFFGQLEGNTGKKPSSMTDIPFASGEEEACSQTSSVVVLAGNRASDGGLACTGQAISSCRMVSLSFDKMGEWNKSVLITQIDAQQVKKRKKETGDGSPVRRGNKRGKS